MRASLAYRWVRIVGGALVITGVAALFACSDKPEPNEVLDVAKVEVKEGEVKDTEVTFEEKLPLAADDVGEIIVATGTVVGTPLAAGFFLLTEGNQVVFVQSTTPVTLGSHVRVVGPIGMAEVASFDGWKTDSFHDTIAAEWDVLDTWFVDATSVTDV